MKAKKAFLIPLSLLVLAACGQQPAGSSVAPSPSSTDAPPVSTDSTGGGGGGGGGGSTSDSSGDSGGDEEAKGFSGIVRIYFHNDTGTEKNKRVYVWCDGVDGKECEWTGDWLDGTKNNGVYYDMDLTSPEYAGFVTDHISFIIKNPGSWAGQSADIAVKFADFASSVSEEGGKKVMSVYACPGEGNAIETYADKTDALGDSMKAFTANADWKSFSAVGSGPVASYKLYCFDDTYFAEIAKGKMDAKEREEFAETYKLLEAEPKAAEFTINLPSGTEIDPQKTYRLSTVFSSNMAKVKKKVATFDKLYDTAKFASKYTYSGNDLGVKYSPEKTEFRVWAPTSTRVRVKIYLYGTPAAYTADPEAAALLHDFPYITAWLEKKEGGVFAGSIEGDLKNRYYLYELFYNEGSYETVDPYATACGVNGLRSAIVDWNETNPEGWDTLQFPAVKPNELTAYEVHVRDFTADDSWISTKQGEEATPRGTYNAFVEEGTKYQGVATGFDHLKELGVNAVQILPAFDQDNDERTLQKETTLPDGSKQIVSIKPGYNWGYNPQNYNCVEGAYSTNPEDAATRIKEYKNMIYKLGKAGIRTIMDVVYNHMSSISKSAFNVVCPRYFFWYDANSNPIDYSGCGNAIRSDRPMSRKFIVDSCKFWCEQYKVKGFRFDLMGVIDSDTMAAIRAEVNKVDPSIVLYGEGWTGEPGGGKPAKGSTTDVVYSALAGSGVGCFNDAGRDGSKGNTAYGSPYPGDGWISEGSNVDNVYNALTQILGQNRNYAKNQPEGYVMDPTQTVNYLACHDNYTLYDQINYLWNKNAPAKWKDGSNEFVMQACTSLTALSLFGQGIGFIHGGDEFFRQKIMNKADDEKLFEQMVETFKYGRYDKAAEKTEYSSTDWPNKDYDKYNYWTEGDGVKIDANTWLVRNSYKYGDAVNAFDWSRKKTYATHYNQMKAAVAVRNSLMGNAFGQSKAQVAAGGTTCWSYNDLFNPEHPTDLMAGFYQGQKDSKTYYIFINKGNKDMDTIGIGNGSYEVLYSSNATHTVGQTFTVDNNLMGAFKLECLLVKQVA